MKMMMNFMLKKKKKFKQRFPQKKAYFQNMNNKDYKMKNKVNNNML